MHVDEQPQARLVDAVGTAMHGEAAPAKGRHFGRLDIELKLVLGFFEQSSEANTIVTVPSVDLDAPRPNPL